MFEDSTTRDPGGAGDRTGSGGMDCAEFEVLLADALDGRLDSAQIERFDLHLATCSRCAPMFGESKLGQAWLATLRGDELEVPEFVVHNILRETIGTVHRRVKAEGSWRERLVERLRQVHWAQPVFNAVTAPRFAMSFGMAFFSITMLLNVLGIHVSSLKNVDLRPSSVMKSYQEASARLVKYYENIRLVYEIESGVNDLKKATEGGRKQGSEQPQERRHRERKPENQTTSQVHGPSAPSSAANAAAPPSQAPPTHRSFV